MYQSGDQVVYGVHGVCVVTGTEHRIVDRKQVDYLVLEPLDQPGTKFSVPSGNAAAMAKLRPMIDLESLQMLLRSDTVRENVWIEDENRRKLRYRELITAGDRKELLQMVHTLHRHKEELALTGRKFHLCDDNFLHDAEKLLNSEFSRVLEIAPGEVGGYLKTVFTKTE